MSIVAMGTPEVASPQRLRLIARTTAGLLVSQLSGYCAPILLGIYIDTYRQTPEWAAALISTESLAMAVAALGSALLLKRYDATRITVIAIICLFLAQFFTAESGTWWALLFERLIAGTAAGIIFGVVCAGAAVCLDPESLIGCSLILMNVIVMGWTLLMPMIGDNFGGREVLAALAAATIAMSIPLISSNSGSRSEVKPSAPASVEFVNRRSIFSIALFIGGLFALPTVLVGFWVVSERVARSVTLPRYVGVVLTVPIVGLVAGAAVATIAGNRIRLDAAMGISAICAGLAGWLLTCADNPWTLGASLLLGGAAEMFIFPYCVGVAAALDGSGRFASIVGSVFLFGVAAGPLFSTPLTATYGYKTTGAVGALVSVFIFLALIPLAHQAAAPSKQSVATN